MKRTLRPGDHGPDVRYIQRLMAGNRLGDFYPWEPNANFDWRMGEAVRCAKFMMGYPRRRITTEAGTEFEKYLLGPPHGNRLLPGMKVQRGLREKVWTPARYRIIQYWSWAILHNDAIHYRQSRPFPHEMRALRDLPFDTDCSGLFGMAYQDAHAVDPHGNHFNGLGSTATLLENGRQVSRGHPGDAVIYGGYPGHHVSVIMQAGDDPLLGSNGSERGPLLVKLSEELRWQGGRSHQIRSYLP
jgi:hypothetical protein